MPKYFFHIKTPEITDNDQIGADCASDEEALAEARQAAKEIVAEWVLEEHGIDGEAFVIVREDGDVVGTLLFKDVLRLY
ncbi:hypothetical protein LH464_15020 [Neorhizobium sp. T786]|uniref:DUF6894 family protein n=1 Tax=Pseudorhizobium xiangyangii TaxID=2883104 RepID=UPI001CFF6142|nr:hypothetical protein [Neorhizobium xiangyangii]MCB5203783.1 hypothetical protein [Neorhizobium xiangyangii]